jgi:hypothetical protein
MSIDKKALPAVDNGTVYPDITKFISAGAFTIDIDSEMKMDDLQKLIPNQVFVKIADCKLNTSENFSGGRRRVINEGPDFDGKLVDYDVVPIFRKLWFLKEKEWVYAIVYNGRIVKIGMTSSKDGLAGRFGSYNTGTQKAMKKGSCATTNFVVTQCNYLALLSGIKVEIFAYEIPSSWTTENIFGRTVQVLNKVAHKYETTLIDIYRQVNGNIPFLCGQS